MASEPRGDTATNNPANANTARRNARWYYGWNVIGAGMTFQAVLFGLTFYSFTHSFSGRRFGQKSLPLLGAIISSRFGAVGFGKVMGLLGPSTTASALGTVSAAKLFDATGSYDLALQIFLFVMLPSGLIMMWLRPRSSDLHPAVEASRRAA